MRLDQLKALAVAAPILFLVVLEGVRFYILEPRFPRPEVLLAMVALEMVGIIVFWWVVWRAIEGIEGELKRLSALEERERIARDLHDGIVQQLFGLGLSLEGTAELAETEPARARGEIDRAVDRLGEIVGDIRHYILDLQWGPTPGQGFPALIRKLAEDTVPKGTMRSDVRVQGDFSDITRHMQWEVWHIAQEALANAVRHSGAGKVRIMLTRRNGRVRLAVTDDGCGFMLRREPPAGSGAPLAPPSAGEVHHGLRNMQERARALGGTLLIRSAPGEGTEVAVDVPLA